MGRKKSEIVRSTENINLGRWTDLENEFYVKFLLDNKNFFEQPGSRKKNQIFMKMSTLMGTRTPNQCRSHHQKVEIYAQTRQVDGLCEYMFQHKIKDFSPAIRLLKKLFRFHQY